MVRNEETLSTARHNAIQPDSKLYALKIEGIISQPVSLLDIMSEDYKSQ